MSALPPADIAIRCECEADKQPIYDLTKRAFADRPYAGGNEQDLINALRECGALEISLVAEQQSHVVGHIAFTPASAADGSQGWFALGPVSVEPGLQRKGIGGALINRGITILLERDAAGCVLVGDLEYYPRFGFQPRPELCPPHEPAAYYMVLPLGTNNPKCVINFHPTFYVADS